MGERRRSKKKPLSLVRVFEESKCTNAHDTELADLHVTPERAGSYSQGERQESSRRKRKDSKGKKRAIDCSLACSLDSFILSFSHLNLPPYLALQKLFGHARGEAVVCIVVACAPGCVRAREQRRRRGADDCRRSRRRRCGRRTRGRGGAAEGAHCECAQHGDFEATRG